MERTDSYWRRSEDLRLLFLQWETLRRSLSLRLLPSPAAEAVGANSIVWNLAHYCGAS